MSLSDERLAGTIKHDTLIGRKASEISPPSHEKLTLNLSRSPVQNMCVVINLYCRIDLYSCALRKL